MAKSSKNLLLPDWDILQRNPQRSPRFFGCRNRSRNLEIIKSESFKKFYELDHF